MRGDGCNDEQAGDGVQGDVYDHAEVHVSAPSHRVRDGEDRGEPREELRGKPEVVEAEQEHVYERRASFQPTQAGQEPPAEVELLDDGLGDAVQQHVGAEGDRPRRGRVPANGDDVDRLAGQRLEAIPDRGPRR